MKVTRGLVAMIVVLVMTFASSVVTGVEETPRGWTDRLIVTYRPGAEKSLPLGVREVREAGERVIVNLGRKAVRSDLKRFTGDQILYVEPDLWATPAVMPDDPELPIQWGTHDQQRADGGYSIRAEGGWAITTGDADLTIAVVDTGITSHPDLDGRTITGYDFYSRDSNPADPGDACLGRPSSWHGTHVAGTIGASANNGIGIAGVNWNSKIQPIRVLGPCGGYASDMADGIAWAAGISLPGIPDNTHDAQVINLSLGGDGPCPIVIQDSINQAIDNGAIVVVAAGNDNSDAANSWPSNCENVIAVAATNRQGKRATYSNFGSVITVAAPGGDFMVDSGILSTSNTGITSPASAWYSYKQGTSMAAPHVSGVLSLLLSIHQDLELADISVLLDQNSQPFAIDARPNSCSIVGKCGYGIIDAQALLEAASGDTPQTIDFEPIGVKYMGEVPFDPDGKASSDLPLSYNASPLSVCDFRGTKLHVLGLGTCTVVARQVGNAEFARAESVTRTFDVAAAFAPSVTTGALFGDTPEVGVAVDLTAAIWSGGPAPTLTHQWYRCSTTGSAVTQSRVPSGCSAISGATSLVYTATVTDLGRYLRLGVTAKNIAARRGVINFSVTSAAVEGAPVRTRALTVAVLPRVGRLMLISNASVAGTAPIDYAYAWYSCTGPTVAATTLNGLCTPIDGQTGSSYTPTVEMIGKFIVASVTATNALGSTVHYSASSRAVR